MDLSTTQAAQELGVTARQVRRAATSGRLTATRLGNSHAVSSRQVQALARTTHRGRNWSEKVQRAALDLLTHARTNELSGSERSRLKQRIRHAEVAALAGQILRSRVSLRRAANVEVKQRCIPKLLGELSLSTDGGLGVLVAKDAAVAARQSRLALDDSGDIAVVEGDEEHRKTLEALALYVFGDARESAAAAKWISAAKEAV